jgi:hypothetical protein
MPRFLVVNEHETSMPFAEKNDDRGKFRFQTFYLGVGADADFQPVTLFGLAADRMFYGFDDGEFYDVPIKFSP